MGTYVAIDMGAESGRLILGELSGDSITVRELHRFKTRGTRVQGRLYWNVLRFYEEIVEGLHRARGQLPPGSVNGVGVDTWGVDFVLLDAQDNLTGLPYHYRDPVMLDAYPTFQAACSPEKIYAATGIQFLPFNTIVQLHALRRLSRGAIDRARSFLMLPDYFNFLLCGEKALEYTDASTTQLLDARTGRWHGPLLDWLGIDPALFPDPRQPGAVLGTIGPAAGEHGEVLDGVPVHLVGSHDTASAIVGCPLSSKRSAYISSGTWSLAGVELDAPVLTQDAMRANFTNEGGVGGKIDFLKNVMGLWLLQESRSSWARASGIAPGYDEIVALAGRAMAGSFPPLVFPDDPRFLNPPDMVTEIRAACKATGQPVPASVGEVAATIFASLAMRYRQVMASVEPLAGFTIDAIHVVGGGSRNALLCQCTADAVNVPVIAGPDEATSIGNVIAQAVSSGELASVEDGRKCISRSFEPVRYVPRVPETWRQQYEDVFLPLHDTAR